MEKRIRFKCWNCKRNYRLLREVEGDPQIIVECPYCGQEAVVDLGAYRSPVVDVYRSVDDAPESANLALNLPDPLPTLPREE